MKRIATVLFCLMLVLGITACGSNVGAGSVESDVTTETKESQQTASVNTEAVPTESTSEVPDETDEPQTNKDILVVYFSATGTTKDVAEKIASIEDADLYEIIPVEPYSDADLNYNDADSRTSTPDNIEDEFKLTFMIWGVFETIKRAKIKNKYSDETIIEQTSELVERVKTQKLL